MTHVARLSGGASQETWSFDAVIRGSDAAADPAPQPGRRDARHRQTALRAAFDRGRRDRDRREAGVAAPRVRYVLKPEDEAGDGYVMDRLPGETIARKILRDSEFDAVRPNLARQCGEVLARIHKVDIEPLSGAAAGGRRPDAASALSRHLRRL